MSNTHPRARRSRLLASCAAAAIATLTVHAPVRAQGFQGAPLTPPQGATVSTPNGTTTIVTVGAPRAIVNWQADSNNFLPQGNTADFVNSAARAGQDFTILNRIKPADPNSRVELNGLVRSTLGTDAGRGAPGGNIWFYSPSGLLVGSGAQINVGGLLLSSLDVLDEQFLAGGTIRFGVANTLDVPFNPNASVEVQGNISATGVNSYVALIAPRVVQSGDVRVNGSAAYVAAEQVDMTINGSLFDIAVQVGSSVGGARKEDAALVHDGRTTLVNDNGENGYGEPAPTARQAVMVAVPKNDAVTMLVQGQIAYEAAANATVVDNKIILSGGRDVQGREVLTGTRPGNPDGVANIRIDNAEIDNDVFTRTTFGSDVQANATGAIEVAARNTFPESGYGAAPADIDFAGSASFVAEGGVDVAALGRIGEESRGGSIQVNGNLGLISDVTADVTRAGNVRLSSGERSSIDVLGNLTVSARLEGGSNRNAINTRTAEIEVIGGELSIGGDAIVTANAVAAFGGEGAGGGNASGGTARIVANRGAIAVGGTTSITASAFGGESSGGIGGTGRGGSALLTLTDAQFSTLSLDVNASAFGGDSFDRTAGAALGGGQAIVTSTGSTIDVESIAIGADSFGGDGLVGGNATAGTAALDVSGGRLTMTDQDNESVSALSISSSSFGGDGDFEEVEGASRGGDAVSGTARITVANAAQLNLTGFQNVTTSAFGGDASNDPGSIAGSAQAGPASIAVTGATLVSSGNGLSILSEAFGGDDGAAGAATGGTIRFDGTDAIVTIAELSMSSDAFGGDGETGGAGTGGTSTVALTRSDVTISALSRGLLVTAQGFGGDGDGQGGAGVGTTATVTSTDSTVDVDDLVVVADGYGGEGDIGGAARGGDAVVNVAGGSFDAGEAQRRVIVTAAAYGGDADSGTGEQAGAAQGGTASVSGTDGAAITLRGRIILQADGFGGSARNTDGVGGNAEGGAASLAADNARITAEGQVLVSADAEGGDGDATGGSAIAGGGARGDGTFVPGGVSLLVGANGRIDAAGLTLRATGTGGQGLDGGDGTGGRITSVIRGTGFLNVLDEFSLFAEGIGGGSDDFGYGDGSFGTGRGGAITLDILGDGETFGELNVVGTTLLSAAANPDRFSVDRLAHQTESSANGGDGFGGTVSVTVNGDFSSGTVRLDVSGRGNAGIDDNVSESEGIAADGSTGQGGTGIVTIGANAETVDIGTLEIDADGLGGDGGDAAVPGRGGVGQGGTAALVVDGGETVIDFVELSAAGRSGNGGFAGFGQGAAGGTGGAGIGGTASLTVNGADPFIGGVFVDLEGSGGRGGDSNDGTGGSGGLGQGGTLALTVSGGGALTIPTQTYSAAGFGGSGGFGESNGGDGGAGGAGVGGTIAIAVTDSLLSAPSDSGYGTLFSARGVGGFGATGRSFGGEGAGAAGDGGAGGSGTGGEIIFTGTNADLTFGGIELDSSGQGGSGASGGNGFGVGGGNGGRGGDASGGTAELALADNGTGSLSITGFAGISVSAQASGGLGAEGGNGVTGGVSGDGGDARGGDVRLDFDGEFALSGSIGGDASAFGGDGGSAFDTGYGQESAAGGAGGSGTGGSVTLAVTGADVRLAPFTQLTSFGNGGIGGGSASLAGGAGGNGNGGILNVAVTGGDLSAPALSLRADGQGASGGEGGDNDVGGNGGRGGDAGGGIITLATAGAGRLVTNPGEGRGLEVHADARAGTGGSGGDGSQVGDTGGRGGNAGDALGGNVSFAVDGGEMDLGDIKVTANGWGGGFSNGGIGAGRAAIPDSNPEDGIDDSQPEIPPTFAPGGIDGRGAGGTIDIRVADAESGDAGRFTAGAVSLRATGRFGGGENDAAGFIGLVRTAAAPGGLFRIASLEAKALGLNAEASTAFELNATAGAIEVLNNASIEVDRDAALRASGSGTLNVGGELNLLVGGNLALTQASGSTPPLASADLVRISAGSVTGATAALTAVRDIRVVSPGSVSFGLLDAGDDILIDAFSASIGRAVTRGPDEPGEEENAGSSIIVNTTRDIEVLIGATAADNIALTSSEGGVANTGAQATSLSAGGRVDIQAELDIRLASIAAVDDVGINSLSGSVTSTGLIESDDDVRVNAFNGSIALTDVAAGDLINLDAGNDLSLANANAGGELRLFGGDIVLTGSGTGANVLASGDTLSLGDLTATSPEFGGGGSDGILLRASGDASIRNGTSATRIDVDTGGFTATGTLTAAEAVLVDLTDRSAGSGIADLGTVRAAYVEIGARDGIQAEDIATAESEVGELNFGRIDLASLDGDVRLDNGSSPGVITIRADNGSLLSAGLLRADVLSVGVTGDIAINDVEVAETLSLSSFGGAISGRRFQSDFDMFLSARDGVNVATLDAFSFINVDGGAGPISIGSATTSALGGEGGGGILLRTNGLVTLDQANSAGFIDVQGRGFGGGDLAAAGYIRILITEDNGYGTQELARAAAPGGIAFDSARAGQFVELDAPGAIDVGTVIAGTDIRAIGASITLADGTAGRDILLNAAEAITVGTALAGDDIEVAGNGGTVTVTNATTTGLGEDLSDSGYGFGDGSNIRLSAEGAVRLDNGTAVDLVSLTSNGTGVNSAGLITAADLNVSSTLDIALTDLDIANGIGLSTGNGSITGTDFASGQFITLFASDAVDVASLSTRDSIFVEAGAIDIGSATTTNIGGEGGGGITLLGAGLVTLDEADSAGFIDVTGSGFGGGTLVAADYIRIRISEDNGYGAGLAARAAAPGGIAFDSADAGTFVELTAPGAIDAGTVIAGTDILASGASIALVGGTAGRDILLNASDGITVGTARAGDDIEIASSNNTVSVASATTTGLGDDLSESGYGFGDGSNIRLAAANTVRLDNGTAVDLVELGSASDSVNSAGSITASNLSVSAGRDIALNDLAIANGISLFAGDGLITGDEFVSGRFISLQAAGAVAIASLATRDNIFVQGSTIDLGNATTTNVGGEGGGGITLRGAGLVRLDEAESAGFIDVTGSGFGGGTLAAADYIRIRIQEDNGYGTGFFAARAAATGGIAFDSADAGTFIDLDAPGVIDAGTLIAGTDILADGASIALASATAGRDILLNASGPIMVEAALAGDDIEMASSDGTILVANATTTGLGEDLSESGYGLGDGSNIRLSGSGIVKLDNGQAVDLVSLTSSGDRVTSMGLIQARDLSVLSGGNIALSDLDITNGISLVAGNGSITGGDFVGGRFIALTAADEVAVASLSASDSIFVQANAIDVSSATTTAMGGEGGSGISLFAAGDLRIDTATSGDFIDLTGSSIDAGSLAADSFVRAVASSEGGGTGTIRFDEADAGSFVSLTADGEIDGGTALAGTDIDASGSAVILASATAGRDLNLNASGPIAVEQAQADDDVTILAGTTALIGTIVTTGAGTDSEADGFRISIEAAGGVSFGAADAFGDLRLVSREGGIVRLDGTGASLIDAGGSLFVSAADDLSLSSVLAGQNITLISGGAIDTGNLTAPGALSLTAGGALSADVVRAGSVIADAASIDFADVELAGMLNLATPGALVLGRAKASDIFGSAGQIRAGALEAAGSIVLSATTDGVEVGTVTAGGLIALIAAGGNVSGTSLTADGAINLTAENGDARLGTGLAGSDIMLAGRSVALTDGTAGRDILVAASGDAAIGSAKAGDDFTATTGGAFAGTTVVTTGEGPDGDDDNGYGVFAEAGPDGSNIRVTSVGAIALATGTAADAIGLASSAGAVDSSAALTAGAGILANAAGAVSLADATAGAGVDVIAGTGITAANLVGGSDVRLEARGGNVALATATAGDDVDVTATGTTTIALATTTGRAPDDGNNGAAVLVTSPGGISIARIDASGGAVLRAAGGAVTVSDDLRSGRPVEASGRSVSLRSLGALGVSAAVATAGNVALNSAGNLSLESADASGNVVAASAATLGVTGTVGAAQIELSSRDIAIGAAAQIGSAQRTGSIQITANGTSGAAPAVVGGAGQGSNYRLDNAEFGRLAAQNVAIAAQGETAALQVDTLVVRQPSVTRTLSLSSSGDVEMIGRLTYENAGADNVVRVNAGRSFFADAAGAGIVVANGQGALTGSIDVDARSIVIASRQAQADLASAATIAARDERLGRNDGPGDEAGFLRANAIRLAASERILVQNSGASAAVGDGRAGLTAGAGGITLRTKGSSPVEIIINGRQDGGTGGLIVGESLIDALTITGQEGAPGNFAQGSSVNGCIIGGNNCAPIPPTPLTFGFSVEPLLSELTEEEDEDEEDGAFAGPPSVGFNQLITTDGSPLLPVIDDPVTGAGNDDLIISTGPLVDIDNSQRDRDEQVNAPVTGTGNEALQGGTTPPTAAGSLPDGQPTIDDPVTGAGNDDLQDGPNR